MIAACDLVPFHLDMTLSSIKIFLDFFISSEVIPLKKVQLWNTQGYAESENW